MFELRTICLHPQRDDQLLKSAEAGMTVGITLKSTYHVHISRYYLSKGLVLGKTDTPSCRVESFTAKVKILDLVGQKRPDHVYEINREKVYGIQEGFNPVLSCHTTHVNCIFDKFEALLDKNGKTLEAPKYLRKNDTAIVKMIPHSKHLCVEPYSKNPFLGRFVIRESGKVIGYGIVTEEDGMHEQMMQNIPPWLSH